MLGRGSNPLGIAVLFLVGLLPTLAQSGTLGALQAASLVNGRLEFSSPVPVLWQEWAPRDLVEFEIQNPPADLLSDLFKARDLFGNAEKPFEVPLPTSLHGFFFYYISESGIHPVQADGLWGTVRFRLSQTSITARSFFGAMVARLGEGSPQAPAGFVLASVREQIFDMRESTRSALELVPPEVREKWNDLLDQARQFWTIQRQYSYSSENDEVVYTFVQWVPDKQCHEACCELRYSVFAGEDSPRLVASYAGQCDI